MSASFRPTERTSLRRARHHGSYDEDVLNRIIDASAIAHIGYIVDGFPVVTPVACWRSGDRLFWHVSSENRMCEAQDGGLPVCVTVSHLDGFVLGRAGITHSLLYRSAMIFGRASLTTDLGGKQRAMNLFVDRFFPGRSHQIRAPGEDELGRITVLSLVIEEASAKIRDRAVADDDRDCQLSCWAGIISVRTVVGKIIADPGLAAGMPMPGNLESYVENAALDDILPRLANNKA
jgi:nitroimidazol reductase NimA-like FMN-containing flavoprotein (pyridoxamine 5'-phosphate oxidase superfamily)